jgi:selenocysteine lyase/cysteine desulfurase
MIPGHETRLVEELSRFAAIWTRPDDGQWPAVLQSRQEFIDRWRRLIDAPEDTLTTAENVTSALYSLIGSLPARHLRGRRILVTADCFPSLHFLLAGTAERFGFTLDTVPFRDGESLVRDEDLVARWQPDVGFALLTWVSSTTSHRCDYAALADHGRRMGSIVAVDITQGVGIIPFSVAATSVDAVLSTSLKWIGGTAGAGILHVQPAVLAECRPEFRGWFSQENPFSWDLAGFRYAKDVRRFDHGTPSVLAAIASLPALRWLEQTGIPPLRAHNLALSDMIISHARRSNWMIASPLDPERRGGSVMLGLPEHLNGSDLVTSLRARHIYCDVRGRTLRLSPGAVTSDAGVAELCRALDIMMAG